MIRPLLLILCFLYSFLQLPWREAGTFFALLKPPLSGAGREKKKAFFEEDRLLSNTILSSCV